MVTGHGNMKSYLHRFKTNDAPDCPCGNDNQTTEHIPLECAILHEETELLKASVAKKKAGP
jgi:hypothetical protein